MKDEKQIIILYIVMNTFCTKTIYTNLIQLDFLFFVYMVGKIHLFFMDNTRHQDLSEALILWAQKGLSLSEQLDIMRTENGRSTDENLYL